MFVIISRVYIKNKIKIYHLEVHEMAVKTEDLSNDMTWTYELHNPN